MCSIWNDHQACKFTVCEFKDHLFAKLIKTTMRQKKTFPFRISSENQVIYHSKIVHWVEPGITELNSLGQLISEWNFGVFKFRKKWTYFFWRFEDTKISFWDWLTFNWKLYWWIIRSFTFWIKNKLILMAQARNSTNPPNPRWCTNWRVDLWPNASKSPTAIYNLFN